MNIVTSKVMREIDRLTIDGGIVRGFVLMDRAGTGAAEEIVNFCKILSPVHVKRFVVISGKGNNGGDGYVIARCLSEKKLDSVLLSICEIDELKGDALEHANLLPEDVEFRKIESSLKLREGDIVVDCLLGTGLSSDIREPYLSIIREINNSQLPVISLDIPSGLNGTDGGIHGEAVLADLTVTIGLPKTGFFKNKGPEYCGRLKCVEIGFPDNIIDSQPSEGRLITPADIKPIFSRRSHNSHKYRCGNVGIVGGSYKYSGAPALSAFAAMKSGAGMVIAIYPDCVQINGMNSLIKIPAISKEGTFCRESISEMSSLEKTEVIVIGPGMTGAIAERDLVREVFKSDKKIVADAGCLIHIADEPELCNRNAATVITPHTGELNRLNNQLGTADGLSLARKLDSFVVEKGQFSRIIIPNGEYSINSSGCSTLATAGSGDVLSGILGAFIALYDDFQAAVEAAVFVHGLTGEASIEGISGTTADDLIKNISVAMKNLSPFN